MIKRGELYYPTEEFKKGAWVNDPKIYKEAARNPVKFWEKLARELFWFTPLNNFAKGKISAKQNLTGFKPWSKGFVHKPPYFKWFVGGKINITANIFENPSTMLGARENKVALIWEPEPVNEKPRIFTYAELFKEVCKCANYLKKLGVRKGDRVGIYLPMIPEVVVAMLACARIGAVHAVVFSAFSPDALRVRLQDTGAKVLITADGYYRRGNFIDLLKNAEEGIEQTEVKKIVVAERSGKSPWQKENSFCKATQMDSEDTQFILYTSGSTGKPKGCVHVCGGYAVQAYWTGKWIFDLHENLPAGRHGDIFWCTSDIGWVTGHTYTIYSPLLNGVATLMFEGAPDFPTPDRWAQIIERHGVTIFYTAPTAIRMFEKYGEDIIKKYHFKKLRLLGSVGEPIDESAWLWYYKNIGKKKCPIVDTWWQTETGGILITSLPGLGPFKPAFTGLPFPGVKVDIKNGNLVILAPFVPGLLRGIYNNDKKYIETYWSQYPSTSSGQAAYFTSDRAVKDKNGLIRIIGRVDDVIKVAGHRISTGEMEAAINEHPEITECAVIGIPDKIKGETPAVFAVYKGTELAEVVKKEIIGQIQKGIGPIALPKEVYLVEDLPKTRSGKIMRRILRKLFTGEELGDLSTLANPESVDKIKKMLNRAFTLIELTIVVAIVGLLASIVLVNSQRARFQANDAQIQSLMHQLRNAAELSYSQSVETYTAVCDEADNSLNNTVELGLLETAIKRENSNQNVACFESADKKEFAASSPLRSQSAKSWCVESAGLSIELNCSAINASRCQCP